MNDAKHKQREKEGEGEREKKICIRVYGREVGEVRERYKTGNLSLPWESFPFPGNIFNFGGKVPSLDMTDFKLKYKNREIKYY